MSEEDNHYEDYEDESLYSDEEMGSDFEESMGDPDDMGFDEDEVFEEEEEKLEPIYSDDIFEDNDGEEELDESESECLDIYDLDTPIPQNTTYRLSKSRFNELNLELVMNNLPLVNILTNDDVFNIMMTSLGNSELTKNVKQEESKLSNDFTLLLASQNLSIDPAELLITFKPNLFSDLDTLDTESEDDGYFKDIVDLQQTTTGSLTFKAISCTKGYCMPSYLISLETSQAIKKVFAFELLREELSERVEIQRKLTTTIDEYETSLLSLYDKIASIKALKSKSIEDDMLTLKIGMMHLALHAEGFEDLFIHKIINDGVIKRIDNTEQLKKSILAHEKQPKRRFSTQKIKEKYPFFSNSSNNSFEVSSTNIDRFEEDIKLRKKQLETLLTTPKSFF